MGNTVDSGMKICSEIRDAYRIYIVEEYLLYGYV